MDKPSSFSFLAEDIIPPSMNTYWRSTCRGKYPVVYLSPKGKAFKESLGMLILNKMNKEKFKIIKNKCIVQIKYYYVSRPKDIDNILKVLLDSLNGILIEDDSLITRLEVDKYKARKNMIYIKVREKIFR